MDSSTVPYPDAEEVVTDVERDPGFLTKEDRAYLLGDEEHSEISRSPPDEPYSQVERNKRTGIRNRIHHALLDFAIVYHQISMDDRELLLNNPNRSTADERQLQDAITYTVAFLYELVDEQEGADPEQFLEKAILEAKTRPGTLTLGEIEPEVTVEIDDSKLIDLGHIGEKLEEEGWEALTEKELDAIEHAAAWAIQKETNEAAIEDWEELLRIVNSRRSEDTPSG